ncbi:MAG: pyruvate kinase [Deferrisomatales bacterium]
MSLSPHKTKIVCTIGPASRSPQVLEALLRTGMNVARLNFSHGGFADHAEVIGALRAASRATGRRVAILADLPGPKIRIGSLAEEPVELEPGRPFTLTPKEVLGDARRASVTFEPLPRVVRPGDDLFLNDGIIQLRVERVEDDQVHCEVVVGGPLRSRKGLNLPGIRLGIRAFTPRDRECLEFALAHGVDAVSQSFVETADDVETVREAARSLGHDPFVIAKIERAGALEHIDEILEAADGIMVARGDLGVEIPIERIAVVQKELTARANRLGKPVITATQMLESMTEHRRPTRAEATDVANAILDGTDCVMLSGESALGRYPVEAAAMLARIAREVEPHLRRRAPGELAEAGELRLVDLVAASVDLTLDRASPAAVMIPTVSGATARNVTRFRLPVWIVAVSSEEATCQHLQFSFGVHAEYEPTHPKDWNSWAARWLRAQGMDDGLVVLTEGPSPDNPRRNHRVEFLDLGGRAGG